MGWKIYKSLKKTKNGVLLQGLPGIGNIGLMSVDYIGDKLKSEVIGEYIDTEKPMIIFVNKKDLEEPKIELHHIKKYNLFFIRGNYQPINERAMWEYAKSTISLAKKIGVKEIITLGGIGIDAMVEDPKVYVTGTSKKLIKKLEKNGAKEGVEKVIGTIVGAAGVLIAEGKRSNIDAAILLGEAPPDFFIDLKTTKRVVEIISSTYNLKINSEEIEKEIKKEKALIEKLLKDIKKTKKREDINYIG